MPIVYLLAPFSTLVPSVIGAQITLFALWLVKGLCSTFAFPCSTILLTNSAASLKVLGTINGMATSVSAIGRAAGPFIAGNVFTWGIKNGYIVAPFWVLSAIAAVTPIAALWLIEGEGFGQENEQEEDHEDEELQMPRKPSQTPTPGTLTDVETDDGIGPLLSRESTLERTLSRHLSHRSSFASNAISESEDESAFEPISTRYSQWEGDQSAASQPSGSLPTGSHRAGSQRSAQEARKGLRRRSSAGVGMGPGFRRMSSNLGQTRSGFGSVGGLDAFTRG